MNPSSFCTVRSFALSAITLAGLASAANAQGFNIDFNDSFSLSPTCSSTYAAAGTAGVWNGVDASLGAVTNLVDKTGAATGVTMATTMTITLQFTNASYGGGDDAALMEDICYGGGFEAIDFGGLANGNYTVYTYAQAPDSKAGFITGVDCTQSAGGIQQVGGALWTGSHVQGTSYSKHDAVVTNGTLHLDITRILSFESINGIQIEPSGPTAGPGSAYCFGDGTGAICPCSGFGQLGAGCVNTSGSGAVLAGTGGADTGNDTLVLTVTNGPANKPGLFFQGNNQLNVPIGDGVLCSNSSLRYSVNSTDAAGGVTQTGFGLNAAPGQTLNYQYWFRDPGNTCGAGGFNFSNGWVSTWL